MITRRTVLSLSAAALLPTFSRAAAAAPSVRRALIIGINAYSSPDNGKDPSASTGGADQLAQKLRRNFGALDGAVNDALLMRQLLRDRFRIHWRKRHAAYGRASNS